MGFISNPPLVDFASLSYKSISHTFNKAVIASYNNVGKYGFVFNYTRDWSLLKIEQRQRELLFITGNYPDIETLLNQSKPFQSKKKVIIFSESECWPRNTKTKEVCYDLADLFDKPTKEITRGIRFIERPEVKIVDYNKVDNVLHEIYGGWNQTKLADEKLYKIAFNPKRYLRSYELKQLGYNIYQKLILIRGEPYGLINFSLDGRRAFELSFLSLFRNKGLRLINDQNDGVMLSCLKDLYDNYDIKTVNLGTAAGIKGLSIFKKKFPFYENIVYSTNV